MSEECCCPDPKNPTPSSPSRESTGGRMESGQAGPVATLLMGQRSLNPDGTSKAGALTIGAQGQLFIQLVDGLPVLANGVLTIDNAVLRVNNGRIANVTVSGSGTVNWVADTSS